MSRTKKYIRLIIGYACVIFVPLFAIITWLDIDDLTIKNSFIEAWNSIYGD